MEEIKNKPILVDLGHDIAKVIRSKQLKVPSCLVGGTEAQLIIISPPIYDENVYTPAESINIYGNDNLRKLRDALTEALGD